jgi:hypothetical protein|tara:strand:- start:7889 stop:8704 length:816 start_codon:yes stop_codon:yes gene_type:complete
MNIYIKNNIANGCLSNLVCSLYGAQIFLKESQIMLNKFKENSSKFNFYLDNECYTPGSPYDKIYNQEKKDSSLFLNAVPIGGYNCSLIPHHKKVSLLDHELCGQILKRLKLDLLFKNRLEDFIEKNNIDDSTFGIHIRMTDSNHQKDPIIPRFKFDDFLKIIKSVEKQYKYIFVASDNNESIEKLIKIYGPDRIKYFKDFWRATEEMENIQPAAEERLFCMQEHWQEAFLDTYVLSRCKAMAGKLSAITLVANMLANESQISIPMEKRLEK